MYYLLERMATHREGNLVEALSIARKCSQVLISCKNSFYGALILVLLDDIRQIDSSFSEDLTLNKLEHAKLMIIQHQDPTEMLNSICYGDHPLASKEIYELNEHEMPRYFR